ncbi:hypothetical protein Ae201684P_003006 [Aphanomyces euteiches]|nr:hypothetical protein Ae201684P_003006 [Aphanomyces euteiches]
MPLEVTFLHLVPTCHMHISTPSTYPLVTFGSIKGVMLVWWTTSTNLVRNQHTRVPSIPHNMPLEVTFSPLGAHVPHAYLDPSTYPLVTFGMYQRCHARVVDDQAPTWSEINTRESQAYPTTCLSRSLFLHLVPTCHMHISTPSTYPLVTFGMYQRCHARVVDDQAPTWSEINTRESQAYPTTCLSRSLFLHLVPTCHMHISTPSTYPLVTFGMYQRCHARVVDDQAPTWSEINTRESQAYPTTCLSRSLFLHLVPTCHMHISTPSTYPLVTFGMYQRCHARVVDDQAPTWSEINTRESQAYPTTCLSRSLFLHLVPTCHMHISTPSTYPLVTFGMYQRCHARVVDDQAPTWSEINTRESQAYPTTCLSRSLFLHFGAHVPHAYLDPSTYPLVTFGMYQRCHARVVDDQAPTWSEINTRESQAYPTTCLSRSLFLHLVPTCHMHISTPSTYPLVTFGMYQRCHARVVDDQAPTWSEINTRESQAYPTTCLSRSLFLHLVPTCHMHISTPSTYPLVTFGITNLVRINTRESQAYPTTCLSRSLFLHLVPTCHMHISTPSTYPLVTFGMYQRCHARVVDDQAPTWSEINTRESQAYPTTCLSRSLFLHLVPTCHMHISTPSTYPLVTFGMYQRCHARVVDDQAPTWSEINTRESQAYPTTCLSRSLFLHLVPTCHMHISTPSTYPLVTFGMYQRCHARVVDDQAPTWSEINTRESQAYPTTCLSRSLFLHLVPTCHMHISTPSTYPLVTFGMYQRCHARVVDDQAPTWSEINTRESQAYPTTCLSRSLFLHLVPTCHMHISTPSTYPLVTFGMYQRCHARVVDDQAPTWSEINTRESQAYPQHASRGHFFSTWCPRATCISRPHRHTHSSRLACIKGVMLVWWTTKHQLGPKSTHESPKHTPQHASRGHFFSTWCPRATCISRPIDIPTRHVWHVSKVSCSCGGRPSTNLVRNQHTRVPSIPHNMPLEVTFSPLGAHVPHAYLDPIDIPTRHVWHVSKVSCSCGGRPSTNLVRNQHTRVPSIPHNMPLEVTFSPLGAHVPHAYLDPSTYPLVTFGMYQRCHARVVDDQAPTWSEINTRESQAYPTTCLSRSLFLHLVPTCHMHISTPSTYPLVTFGMYQRCHARVVDDQAPTWSEINTRESQAYPTTCLSRSLFLHLVPTCHMHISTPSTYPLVTFGMYQRCHARVVDDQAPTWSEINTRESQAYPTTCLSRSLFLHLVPTCHMHISTPSTYPLVTFGMYQRCHARVVDDQAPTWSEINTRESQAYPTTCLSRSLFLHLVPTCHMHISTPSTYPLVTFGMYQRCHARVVDDQAPTWSEINTRESQAYPTTCLSRSLFLHLVPTCHMHISTPSTYPLVTFGMYQRCHARVVDDQAPTWSEINTRESQAYPTTCLSRSLFLHLVPTCHMHISTPSTYPLVTFGMYQRCHARVVDDQAPTWSEINTRESQAYPTTCLSRSLFLHLVPTCHMHISTPSTYPLVTFGMYQRCHARVVDDQAPTWSEINTRESQAYPTTCLSRSLFLHLVPTCHMHISTPSTYPLVTFGMYQRCHARVVDDQAPTWSEINTRESQAYPTTCLSRSLFLHLVPTCHMHISTPSTYPLVTFGMYQRCHARVVDDQAPTWSEINTRESQAYPTTCLSRSLFLHLVPTCHMHISTPSTYPLVTFGMYQRCHARVVDDQAPTWSEINTRESQAYPTTCLSRSLFLHLVPTCHMHISTPSTYPLVTFGMYQRCHARVVDDQAPTWSEINTRESQAYPTTCLSRSLFLHLVPTCHMHISTPSTYPLVTFGMYQRCHARVVDDQAPTWSEINTRESQAYPTTCLSRSLFLHLVPTCHMHISTPSTYPLVTFGMYQRCHARVVDDQAPTWSEINTRESQAYPTTCLSQWLTPRPLIVNVSSEALTQRGRTTGTLLPVVAASPDSNWSRSPVKAARETGSMLALEATRPPPMGTPCGSVYFPPGASSEGRGWYPDLGSRRSNGVPQSPCCGDGMDSPSTPVTGGLAPAFLVTNGTEPVATNRVAPCAEPPRTGEEEEKSQEDVDMVSGDAEGKDSSETEALTDEGNTQIHSEVDGSGDINGQRSHNKQSNQDTVDKSVAQGNGVVDPPSAADKAQGDQEQQNAEKANAWTQKASGKESASSKKDSKQGNAPKGAKHRNIGAHAIADDDIARCEAMADAFYKDSGDMDAFIENILLTPQSQVYELTVKFGRRLQGLVRKNHLRSICQGKSWFVMGLQISEHLDPQEKPTDHCTTFRLGGKDFLVPKYSRYGNNYYVTFNKVSHPSMAKAIVKKMAALTKSVIAAFNPTAGQNIKSPHLRVIFKSSAPPAVLVPKSGDALREITITDPSGQPFVVVFQHKIAALNKKLPPSIASRRAEAKAEKAKAKATKAEAKSPPSEEKEPEHDGDDHDQDPGTHAEGNADSSEASGDRQDEQPQPTATSHNSDVDMSDKQQEDVEMSTNEPPAPAPPNEQPMNSLDLQLVTGYRSGPAPKRTLPSSPRLDPLPTSNRFHILEEEDVELSFEDFAVPRIVLEDSSAPRPKKTKGKAKKQRLNKSAAAHLELAKKIIRDKKVEGSITECQRILRDDPQLVAHAMYAQDEEDLSLFQSLVATKTIERKMVLLKAQGKPHNYKHHVNFMAQSKIHPAEILEELTTDIPEIKRILFALATALTVLLNQEATRLPDTNCLTDWSLFALIENFSDNLEKFTLPAPVLSAISMLKSITNNYHIDELCSKAHHFMNADEIDPLDLEDDQL